ncbi:MAG TPA: hypothetical protein VE133_07155, partial [Candidatus Sulfotelmatobacter sp.]|nr:hypothetical protein [Candidatus Sulfotelmatobacter sp.]
MKIGTESKKKVRWMIALLVIAVLVGLYNFRDLLVGSAAPLSTSTANSQRKGPKIVDTTLDPRIRVDILAASQSIKYETGGRNIFRMEEKPIEKTIASARLPMGPEPPPTPTPPPPPPPINLKFYGFASKANEPKRIFLADEGEVFLAKQGDIV